jgi:hypothetical protein
MKAFPRPNTIHPDDLGMDLRDYFAAKAMQGMMDGNLHPSALKAIALVAYQTADEMMKARKE